METVNLYNLVFSKKEDYNNYIDKLNLELLYDYNSKFMEFTYEKIQDIKSDRKKDSELIISLDKENQIQYQVTYGNLLSYLVVFKIFNHIYNEDNNLINIIELEDYIFDCTNPKEFNNILDNIYNDLIDYDNIKELIFNCMSDLTHISVQYVNGTISIYDICKLYKNCEEVKKIMDFKINSNDSYAKMIKDIKDNLKNFSSLLEEYDTCFRSVISSDSGFNIKQASQLFTVIGPKPDVYGNIHPHVLETNFLNGLRGRDDYFVNAENARKSLITNFYSVKSSGYLTRKLSMLCLDVKLSDTEKCDTKPENYPKVFINNEKTLKRYKNRFYYDWGDGELKEISMKNKDELLGKTLSIASPITCSCKDGICRTCYGKLSKSINKKTLSDGRIIKDNIGLIAALLLTEVITQMLLSTKHLLEANTDPINWGNYTDYFNVYTNSLGLKETVELENIIVHLNEDEQITLIINGEKLSNPVILKLASGYKLSKIDMNNNYKIIKSSKNSNGKLFDFIVENNELSAVLNGITDLLEKSGIKNMTYDEALNKFLELLNKVGFTISSEHIEVILRELLTINNRESFAKEIHPYYYMQELGKKVLGSSITKSILFERIKGQFLDINTYQKNNQDSLLDFLL